MNDDAVIEEVRDARRRVAEAYGSSVREIAEALMREQEDERTVEPTQTSHRDECERGEG